MRKVIVVGAGAIFMLSLVVLFIFGEEVDFE